MKEQIKSSAWYTGRFEFSIDLIRIYLGLGLMIRGLLNIGGEGRSVLVDQINSIGSTWAVPYLLGHYIILAHALGGLFLMLGILTRISAIVQIPILLGAVLFIHAGQPLLTGGLGLEFSLLVLILLILVAWCGPGRLSMDVAAFHRIKLNKRQ